MIYFSTFAPNNFICKTQKPSLLSGLGYVGLPLAAEFGKKYNTIGIDVNKERIEELEQFHDRTLEMDAAGLKAATKLSYTADINAAREAQIFIITVPTPVDKYNNPDLTPGEESNRVRGQSIEEGRHCYL